MSDQLRMFMSAREILASHQPSDWDRMKNTSVKPTRPETNDEMMQRKLTESKKSSFGHLHQSIAKEGVRDPVHLSHQFGDLRFQPRSGISRPMIGEGHHRIAASMDIDPDRLIPVMHHATMMDIGDWYAENT